jgi:hypothetical protein
VTAGRALALLGLLADLCAGWLTFSGQARWGLLLHVPAVAVWAHGVALRERRPLWRPLLGWPRRRQLGEVSADGLLALVLGLALVPGCGPAALTLAAGVARLLPRPTARARAEDEALTDDVDELLRRAAPVEPLLDLEIQPLVDALVEPDIELRRGAIQLLARDHSPDGVRLTRELLSDRDPDIRNDAALALSGYQNESARRLDEAQARVAGNALDPDAYVALADACRAAVVSGLYDELTCQGHLDTARAALGVASTLAPERAEVWSALAQTQHELGDIAGARRTLARRADLARASAEVALVGMDIAFEQRDWDELLTLASASAATRPADAERRELLRWWAAAQPRDHE